MAGKQNGLACGLTLPHLPGDPWSLLSYASLQMAANPCRWRGGGGNRVRIAWSQNLHFDQLIHGHSNIREASA